MSGTFEALRGLVAEQFHQDAQNLLPETTLTSLGIDSLGQIELMFDLEDHFDVRFGDHQEPLKDLQAVAELIDAVKLAAPLKKNV
jgi:acyl carrier protein